MTAALHLESLSAGHHGVPVARDLNITLEPGEIVALIGPNGAGKSTTLDTIAGVLSPIAGSIQVHGHVVRGTADAGRRGLGYLPERRGLFADLTVRENLWLRARSRRRGDALLGDYPTLERLAERRAGLLSGGEQQILALAAALASEPTVLLIDEMTMGLAPVVVTQLVGLVRRTAAERGIAVLVVEQHVSAALDLAQRAYVMQQGEVVMEGPSEELRSRLDELHATYLPGRQTGPTA